MTTETRITSYWREEFVLAGVLLMFFVGILALSDGLPFDARLFPMVIGTAGVLFSAAIIVREIRTRRSGAAPPAAGPDDPAAGATWPRFLTALLSAPAFGLAFWLFGFVAASLAAMLAMPLMMGYPHRRLMVVIAVVTVAVLALAFPHLVGVDLPNGVVGDWLIETFRDG
jgi:uncharacterized membrane protein